MKKEVGGGAIGLEERNEDDVVAKIVDDIVAKKEDDIEKEEEHVGEEV